MCSYMECVSFRCKSSWQMYLIIEARINPKFYTHRARYTLRRDGQIVGGGGGSIKTNLSFGVCVCMLRICLYDTFQLLTTMNTDNIQNRINILISGSPDVRIVCYLPCQDTPKRYTHFRSLR